jgi:signal transduction histidine kinase
MVELSIDDDGPGIPADDRQRVFERFVRLDAARTKGDGGTGLGLAIAHDIVVAHGGAIAIGEAPIGGARVTVTLPSAGAAGGTSPPERTETPQSQTVV